MRKFWRKWKSKAGESLIETLCAILIIALTATVLYNGIVLAAKLNKQAKEADAELMEQSNVAEEINIATASASNVTVNGKSIPVAYYKDTDGGMMAYRLK